MRFFLIVYGRSDEKEVPVGVAPSATGRGRGPPETSSRVARTQETVGGYGV